MFGLLVFASWFSLAAYSAWFFGAKQHVTMSPSEIRFLWHVHRKESHCNAPCYVKKYDKKKNTVGFKCSCEYEHESKRPMV